MLITLFWLKLPDTPDKKDFLKKIASFGKKDPEKDLFKFLPKDQREIVNLLPQLVNDKFSKAVENEKKPKDTKIKMNSAT